MVGIKGGQVFLPHIPIPAFSVGTTTLSGGLNVDGQSYSDTGTLNNGTNYVGTDVVTASIGRGQLILGSGAFVAAKE